MKKVLHPLLFFTVLLTAITSCISQPSVPVSIYDLIINKSESPKDFPNDILSLIDFSDDFSTQTAVKALGIDFANKNSGEHYYVSDERFLKQDIPGLKFKIYYTHKYGDQIEKILWIERKDTVMHKILALDGGDSNHYWSSTEFKSNNTLIETHIDEWSDTDYHYKEYVADSVVTILGFDELLNFTKIKRDSFHIDKKNPIFHKHLKDSIFELSGTAAFINERHCYWKYKVRYTDDSYENSKAVNVRVLQQNLIDLKTQKVILNGHKNFSFAKDVIYLRLSTPEYESYDLDLDGKKDFVVHCGPCSGSGGEFNYAYLYNPSTETYEHADLFSGAGVRYDSLNNRVARYWRHGGGSYRLIYNNLKPNRRDLAFIEIIQFEAKSVLYEKWIDDKLVIQKPINGGFDDDPKEFLERQRDK